MQWVSGNESLGFLYLALSRSRAGESTPAASRARRDALGDGELGRWGGWTHPGSLPLAVRQAAAKAGPPCRWLPAVWRPHRWPVKSWDDFPMATLAKSLQSCPTLRDSLGPSPPGSSVRGISRQECWSGVPFPPPGDLPDPGIEPKSLMPPALAGGFFTTSAPWEAGRVSRMEERWSGERGLCPRPAGRGCRPTTASPTMRCDTPGLCTHSSPGLACSFTFTWHLRDYIKCVVVFRVGRRLSLVGGASTYSCHQPLKPLGRDRTGTGEQGLSVAVDPHRDGRFSYFSVTLFLPTVVQAHKP